eukprot:5579625-Heterocapsa_arctica.AAC.1
MERLQLLHDKSDAMMEQVEEIKHMASNIRSMMGRWVGEEPAHDADKQEELTRGLSIQGNAPAEEEMQEPQ